MPGRIVRRGQIHSFADLRPAAAIPHLPLSGSSLFSTLRSTRDIRAVLATRRSAHGKALSVHARLTGAQARVAVVAGRGVGGAVQRNRAKRRLRAVLRSEGLLQGVDLVVVAKPSAASVAFMALVEEYSSLRARVGERLVTATAAGSR